MNNIEFNREINEDLHKQNIELLKKNREIASASLRAITTIVDLLSNLSITEIPSIATKIAKLSNPLIEASTNLIEVQAREIEYIKTLKDIKKEVKLEDLDKINSIENRLNE